MSEIRKWISLIIGLCLLITLVLSGCIYEGNVDNSFIQWFLDKMDEDIDLYDSLYEALLSGDFSQVKSACNMLVEHENDAYNSMMDLYYFKVSQYKDLANHVTAYFTYSLNLVNNLGTYASLVEEMVEMNNYTLPTAEYHLDQAREYIDKALEELIIINGLYPDSRITELKEKISDIKEILT